MGGLLGCDARALDFTTVEQRLGGQAAQHRAQRGRKPSRNPQERSRSHGLHAALRSQQQGHADHRRLRPSVIEQRRKLAQSAVEIATATTRARQRQPQTAALELGGGALGQHAQV